MTVKYHGDAGDLREAADIEALSKGSQTTITSLRRGARRIEALEARLQSSERVIEAARIADRVVYVPSLKEALAEYDETRP